MIARDTFEIALAHALRPEHDGQGFHVTPGDSGGATAWGIIKPTLATYLRRDPKTITDAEIRALTRESVAPIYQRLFWDAHRCGNMPAPLGVMVFDFACSNPTAATVRLQQTLSVAQDGRIGPLTIAAAHREWALHAGFTLERYHVARLNFYRSLSSYSRFGRGWDARASRCLTLALQLAGA
jgi:lysozyme family protein